MQTRSSFTHDGQTQDQNGDFRMNVPSRAAAIITVRVYLAQAVLVYSTGVYVL